MEPAVGDGHASDPPAAELLLPADETAAGEITRPAESACDLPGAAQRTNPVDSESVDDHVGDEDSALPPLVRAPPGLPTVSSAQKAARKMKLKTKQRWRRASISRALTSKPAGRPARRVASELWKEFELLDEDHNGMLDVKQLSTLVSNLGFKLSKREITEALHDLDPDNTGRIALGSLDDWYYHLKQKRRNIMRRDARAIFDSYSTSSGGGSAVVTHQGFVKMMRKHRAKFGLNAGFDPDSEWPKLDERGPVTFQRFEHWWKQKIGNSKRSMDVLPEFLRLRLDEETYSLRKREAVLWAGLGARLQDRSGRAWWNILRAKLRTLIRMQDVWGNLDEVYDTHQSSAFGEAPLGRLIIDPDGRFSDVWDVIGVIMLLYVIINVPLSVSFGIEPSVWSSYFFIDMVVDIYFLADIFLNFRTAIRPSSGIREGRAGKIAQNYCKSWFWIDFVSCLPVQYIGYLTEGSWSLTSSDPNSMVKGLRLFRLAKMLRIARLRKAVAKYSDDVKTAHWAPLISILMAIVCMCHMLACLWYTAGDNTQTLSNGKLIVGWVIQEPDWTRNEDYLNATCVHNPGCRQQLDAQVQNISLSTRYATSMYYVFNSLENGFTDAEKVVAVMSELLLGLIYGMLAGLMSSMLIVMGSGEAELQKKVVQLRKWMQKHRMPKQFQLEALDHFYHVWETKLPVDLEHEMKDVLPPAMDLFIVTWRYRPALRNVPLFRALGEEVLAELCRVVRPQLCLNGQYVMKAGDIGTDMFVLISGELKVSEATIDVSERTIHDEIPEKLRFLGYLSDGAFFGEVPLLSSYASGSEIRKRTVQSVTNSSLVYFTRDAITDMRHRFPELDARLRRFATVGTDKVKSMNMLTKRYSMDKEEIKRLQRQTLQNVKATKDGAIGLRSDSGAGHRLTRYMYELISDWSDTEPTPKLFEMGDRVRVNRSGPLEGQTAEVLDPASNGCVEVRMDSEKDGKTMLFLNEELTQVLTDAVPSPPSGANDVTPSPRRKQTDGTTEGSKIVRSTTRVPSPISSTKLESLYRRVDSAVQHNFEEGSVRKAPIWIKYEQGSRAGEWRQVYPYLQDTKFRNTTGGPKFFNALETSEYEYSTSNAADYTLLGSSAARTIHVGGLEANLNSSSGSNIEDEDSIKGLFSKYGWVMAVTLQYRSTSSADEVSSKPQASWALVSFQTSDGMQAALAAHTSEDKALPQSSEQPMRITRFDPERAMTSSAQGTMSSIAKEHAMKIRAEEVRLAEELAGGGGSAELSLTVSNAAGAAFSAQSAKDTSGTTLDMSSKVDALTRPNARLVAPLPVKLTRSAPVPVRSAATSTTSAFDTASDGSRDGEIKRSDLPPTTAEELLSLFKLLPTEERGRFGSLLFTLNNFT